jgi:DNA modification methylase
MKKLSERVKEWLSIKPESVNTIILDNKICEFGNLQEISKEDSANYLVPKRYIIQWQRKLTEYMQSTELQPEYVEFKKEYSPTFFDSKRSPIHRWYGIVPGFSYASVIDHFIKFHLRDSDLILDPFVGCGTTVVTAKALGLNAIGIEAHPFLAWVAKVKTFWEFEHDLEEKAEEFLTALSSLLSDKSRLKAIDISSIPKFIHKIYPDEQVLAQLILARDFILSEVKDEHLRDLYLLALVKSLKEVTRSKVDGIYIAPTSLKKTSKTPLEAISQNLRMMVSDLILVRGLKHGKGVIIEGDCRDLSFLEDDSIDFAYTSPPYLNNFDYAEMTRLELYFLGIARNWKEITEKVRSKLITNTTTQIKRSVDKMVKINPEIGDEVKSFLENVAKKLSKIRLTRGGRKDYDIVVIKYFNDMYVHLREMYRVLKKGKPYILTLGDSALYGVYIPTDEMLMKIAFRIGFQNAQIEVIRRRGNRSQIDVNKRTRVPLRESRVILVK